MQSEKYARMSMSIDNGHSHEFANYDGTGSRQCPSDVQPTEPICQLNTGRQMQVISFVSSSCFSHHIGSPDWYWISLYHFVMCRETTHFSYIFYTIAHKCWWVPGLEWIKRSLTGKLSSSILEENVRQPNRTWDDVWQAKNTNIGKKYHHMD